jgi:hypothetical protein
MSIVKSIYNFLSDMGRARAASHLARTGDYKGAQKLMMAEFKGWI